MDVVLNVRSTYQQIWLPGAEELPCSAFIQYIKHVTDIRHVLPKTDYFRKYSVLFSARNFLLSYEFSYIF